MCAGVPIKCKQIMDAKVRLSAECIYEREKGAEVDGDLRATNSYARGPGGVSESTALCLQVHPFCYQMYKSSVCFVTCFIVLAWNRFIFTWWGTVRFFSSHHLARPIHHSAQASMHTGLQRHC